ncbi:hypothetical protein [Liquorilactobacillus hordei]|uniref:hypothetical protein n=1 Tax=Liquorilactobacillus hordei TaxID=468911 RepID=UPI0039ED8A84
MEINATKVAYELNNGETSLVSIDLYGNDSSGDYVNATVKVVTTDLAEDKTFGDLTQNELITLAKTKLANFTMIK